MAALAAGECRAIIIGRAASAADEQLPACQPSDAQSIRAHSIRVILIGPIYIWSFLIWLLDLPAGKLK